jgi:hypothetical protein
MADGIDRCDINYGFISVPLKWDEFKYYSNNPGMRGAN